MSGSVEDQTPEGAVQETYLRARRQQLQRAVELHNLLAASVNALMGKDEHTALEEQRIEQMLKEGCLLDDLVQSIGTELGVKLHIAAKPALAH